MTKKEKKELMKRSQANSARQSFCYLSASCGGALALFLQRTRIRACLRCVCVWFLPIEEKSGETVERERERLGAWLLHYAPACLQCARGNQSDKSAQPSAPSSECSGRPWLTVLFFLTRASREQEQEQERVRARARVWKKRKKFCHFCVLCAAVSFVNCCRVKKKRKKC